MGQRKVVKYLVEEYHVDTSQLSKVSIVHIRKTIYLLPVATVSKILTFLTVTTYNYTASSKRL